MRVSSSILRQTILTIKTATTRLVPSEEGNIEKHQRPLYRFQLLLAGAASPRSLTAAIFSLPRPSFTGGHEEATFPRAREPRVAQLYGFPGHKTSRTRETLVCRGAKPFATNFLASPSRPRASFTISSFLASNLRGEIEPTIGFNRRERKDETSKIRSLLANVPREEESRTKFGKLEGSLSKKSLGNQLYHGYIYIKKVVR